MPASSRLYSQALSVVCILNSGAPVLPQGFRSPAQSAASLQAVLCTPGRALQPKRFPRAHSPSLKQLAIVHTAKPPLSLQTCRTLRAVERQSRCLTSTRTGRRPSTSSQSTSTCACEGIQQVSSLLQQAWCVHGGLHVGKQCWSIVHASVCGRPLCRAESCAVLNAVVSAGYLSTSCWCMCRHGCLTVELRRCLKLLYPMSGDLVPR